MYIHDIVHHIVHVHVYVYIMYMYMKNVEPGQVFELVSSHQQGICTTCLAHHPALDTHDEPESTIICILL